jgi:Cell shape-determining protein
MRNYLDSRSRRSQAGFVLHPIVLALLLLSVTGVLFVLDYLGIITGARQAATVFLSPITGVVTSSREESFLWLERVNDVPRLSEIVAEQQAQIAALEATVIALQQNQVENVTLRKQLSIREQYNWAANMIPAEIVARSPDAGRRTMSIALGSEAGVTVGMAVIGQQGSSPPALVGVVEQVTPRISTVLLITDFGSQISARVIHENTSATGIVQGQWQRGSRLRFDQVSRDAQFVIGDVVVTAGLSQQLGIDLPLSAIPAGIPIGTVEATGTSGHTLVAELRPFVDPDQVRDVWVVLAPSQ